MGKFGKMQITKIAPRGNRKLMQICQVVNHNPCKMFKK